MPTSRRKFLKLAGATGLLLPSLVERALGIPPMSRSHSIRDVRHIVVLMQENRSFDHYFGAFNGVRGFGDPRPLRLPGGQSVWSQPSTQHPDGFVWPYHGDSRATRSLSVTGSDQSHQENLHIFNRGRYNRWGHSGELHNRMLHYTAGDLPFYYALADAFTICDAYHCSTMTQTQPNRLHLFTGCNGGGGVGGEPEMSNYGEDETPNSDMSQDRPLRHDAFQWTTYAERLQAAGVRWKVYQEYDNFGDNSMAFFPAFRCCTQQSTLYQCGRAWVSEAKAEPDRTRSDGEQLVAEFRRDVASGNLPQVSWIVPAAELSEHPDAVPARGEHLTAQLIEVLVDHPDVFAQTAFILNYDEAGGFFDHMPPPVPPVGSYRGRSTVPLDGEMKAYPSEDVLVPGQHPIGLGVRTPAIVVSPWSRGGNVCSELFDHTSVIQLMERCFGVPEPNISAWRRSVCGDLTSAFDFSVDTGTSAIDVAPPPKDFLARIALSEAGSPVGIPALQCPPVQAGGRRPHRSLPYDLAVRSRVTAERILHIEMDNGGTVGVVVTVYDNLDRQEPWHFTIGAGHRLVADEWHDDGPLQAYDLTLRGPNGFWRRFCGALSTEALGAEAHLETQSSTGEIEICISNEGGNPLVFNVVVDEAYPCDGPRTRRIEVAPGAVERHQCVPGGDDTWYDITVTVEGHVTFSRRFAGKVEIGRAGLTDPGIGATRLRV